MSLATAIAVIVALALILLEFLFSRHCEDHAFESKDSRSNLIIAITGTALNTIFRFVTLFAYVHITRVALIKIEMNWITWAVLIVLADLVTYLFHYAGHRFRFFWAAHVVHHSSLKYNLTTAVRLPIMNFFYRFLFYAPLCLMGFPPYAVVIAESVNFLYQFFLHTSYIRTLGWLEYVLNTPSHHRVHHASNPIYLDKNFGGILIIWDRMFGTFMKEHETPRYGITHNLGSHNVFRILFHEWISMGRDLVACRNWELRYRALFGRPGETLIVRRPSGKLPKPTLRIKPCYSDISCLQTKVQIT